MPAVGFMVKVEFEHTFRGVSLHLVEKSIKAKAATQISNRRSRLGGELQSTSKTLQEVCFCPCCYYYLKNERNHETQPEF